MRDDEQAWRDSVVIDGIRMPNPIMSDGYWLYGNPVEINRSIDLSEAIEEEGVEDD